VLLRGGGRPPLTVDKLPAMGPVASFARVQLRDEQGAAAQAQPRGSAATVRTVAVPLRLAPDPQPWRDITATVVRADQLGLLRQLAYRLGRRTLEQTTIAFTPHGAFLVRKQGIEGIPVGDFFRQIHPQIFVSAGFGPVPAVAPSVLFQAFGAPPAELIFLHRDGGRWGVPKDAFINLEHALLDAQTWNQLTAERVASTLATSLPQVSLESPGFRPLRDVAGTDGQADGAGGSSRQE
jgi:hypothetical protein